MRELLGVDKTLQSIHGELVNNTWKLAELKKDDPTYSKEQRQLYTDRFEDLKTEPQS